MNSFPENIKNAKLLLGQEQMQRTPLTAKSSIRRALEDMGAGPATATRFTDYLTKSMTPPYRALLSIQKHHPDIKFKFNTSPKDASARGSKDLTHTTGITKSYAHTNQVKEQLTSNDKEYEQWGDHDELIKTLSTDQVIYLLKAMRTTYPNVFEGHPPPLHAGMRQSASTGTQGTTDQAPTSTSSHSSRSTTTTSKNNDPSKERMHKRELKARERMHKREVKGAVKQAKYASRAGKPSMMQKLGDVAKTAGKIGAFAAGMPASYASQNATPKNPRGSYSQRRRINEDTDINTFMDKQKSQEKGDTLKFIKSVSEKNYAGADKYLKQIVDNKLTQKMSKFKGTQI